MNTTKMNTTTRRTLPIEGIRSPRTGGMPIEQ